MNQLLPIAQKYAELGYSVIPLNWRAKRPTLKDWQNLRLKPDDLPNHFDGRPQNIGVLLGEPSKGLVDIDLDCSEAVALAPTFLPSTDSVFGRASKPASHYLYTVAPVPKTLKYQHPIDGDMLLELRSTGAQTVFPGSSHESGEPIKWSNDQGPYHATPVDVDTLTKALNRLASAVLLARHWPAGNRHNASLAVAGGLRRAGFTLTETRQFITAICKVAGDPEGEDRARAAADTFNADKYTGWNTLTEILPPAVVNRVRIYLEGESKTTIEVSAPSKSNDPVSDAAAGKPWPDTDIGNAHRLRHLYGDRIRYEHTRQRWLVWEGTHWQADENGSIWRLAEAVADSIRQEAAQAPDKVSDMLMGWSKKSQSKARQEALIHLARNMTPLAITTAALDTDDWTFNLLNGTVDLRSGELREHRRDDHITRVSPVTYEPDARCPLWLECLNQWMRGDSELISYLQTLAGYWLTGDVNWQILPIFYGEGANGKSTFLDTLAAILGPYAGIAPPDLLIANPGQSHPTELADLWGKRFVIASETEEGKSLRIALVKSLTGDSTIKARFMRQDFFEFRRTHKLVLSTNHKPRVADATNAAWRRLKLVPWTVIIPQEQQDRNLMAKLKAEAPGILLWMLDGVAALQEEGIVDPEIIKNATLDYRHDENPIQDFLDEMCMFAPNAWIANGELYQRYNQYCATLGEKFTLSRRKFVERIVRVAGVKLEVKWVGGSNVRGFCGIH
jgi:P4 family phage/plasmid primase-like protien